MARTPNRSPTNHRETGMGIIIWLIVGGIVGWLASIIMKRDGQQGILLNIVVGIVGAFIGGWLIGPLLGAGSINDGLTARSFVVSPLGALILLAIVNLCRAGNGRRRSHVMLGRSRPGPGRALLFWVQLSSECRASVGPLGPR